jgi:MATE family multidrug resistance protein
MRHAAPAGPAVAETVASELKATLAVALPLAGAQLAQVMMGFTAWAMMGRLGGDALAAGGLGSNLAFTVMLICQGVLNAVGPLAAHALGAREGERVAATVGSGLVIAAALSLFGMMLVSQIPLGLAAIGHAPSLVAATERYTGAVLWGMPAALGYAVLRSYLAATGRTLPLMVTLFLCLGLNIALNYALIFGHFGASALGIAGAGYANAAIQWVQFAILALTVVVRHGGRDIVLAMCRPRSAEIAAVLRLGLPIAGIFALESGMFTSAAVLAGLLGTAALAAHQVGSGIGSIGFMVPLAFGHAATVRVALSKGAGAIKAARRAGMVAFACGVGFMGAMALFILTQPRVIIGLYLDRGDPANAAAIAIAVRLLFVSALFQIFDGAQVVAAGALRGLRDTAVPMLIAGIGYWAVGFASAWALAFPLGLGAVGLWWGLAAGLAAVAIPLAWRFLRLTLHPRALLA